MNGYLSGLYIRSINSGLLADDVPAISPGMPTIPSALNLSNCSSSKTLNVMFLPRAVRSSDDGLLKSKSASVLGTP